jgi:hypothetical protein
MNLQNLNLRHIYFIRFFLFLTPFFARRRSSISVKVCRKSSIFVVKLLSGIPKTFFDTLLFWSCVISFFVNFYSASSSKFCTVLHQKNIFSDSVRVVDPDPDSHGSALI